MKLSEIVREAKTNLKHVEQARARVQMNGNPAFMTLNLEKPSRYYIHLFGPRIKSKVLDETYDPREAVKEWFSWMKKYKGKLLEKRAEFFASVSL